MIPTHSELCAFATAVHDLAKIKGWYDSPRRWSQLLMLIQGELHEANECLRSGYAPDHVWCGSDKPGHPYIDGGRLVLANDGAMVVEQGDVASDYNPATHGKPEGFIIEVADCVIRALDAITYAKGRPLIVPPLDGPGRAALKRQSAEEFVETALCITPEMTVRDLGDVVIACLEWCEAHKLPLWRAMAVKHAYNLTRPHKHGKRY